MAWRCSGSTNTELIENLCKAGLIKHERVKEAMIGVSCHPTPQTTTILDH
jgi:protein-L-isoaspartate(D-aspartate) O-methyltransferase